MRNEGSNLSLLVSIVSNRCVDVEIGVDGEMDDERVDGIASCCSQKACLQDVLHTNLCLDRGVAFPRPQCRIEMRLLDHALGSYIEPSSGK